MPCNLKTQQREHPARFLPPSPPWPHSNRIPKSSTRGAFLPTRGAMSKMSALSQNNCLPRHLSKDSHTPLNFQKRFPVEGGVGKKHPVCQNLLLRTPRCQQTGMRPLLPLQAKTPRHKLAMFVPLKSGFFHIAMFSPVLF